jgi:3-phenylpropionate/cinnamic acid dioxygenase small subunit
MQCSHMNEVVPDLASQSQNGSITRRLISLTRISNIEEQKTLSQPNYQVTRMTRLEKFETTDWLEHLAVQVDS